MDPITLIFAAAATWITSHGKMWQKVALLCFMLLVMGLVLGFFFLVGADVLAWFAIGAGIVMFALEFGWFKSIFGSFTNFLLSTLVVLFLVWLGYSLYNGIPIA